LHEDPDEALFWQGVVTATENIRREEAEGLADAMAEAVVYRLSAMLNGKSVPAPKRGKAAS
jgi:hypothetical protein